MVNGSQAVDNTALGSSLEASFLLDYGSIMGVTVPLIQYQASPDLKPDYGFASTSAQLDRAFRQLNGALELIAKVATAEGVAFALTKDIRATQRRVNALEHVLIPMYAATAKRIATVLEEKERDEFVRTKRIKRLIRSKLE